ncbi:hypothetical protein D9619_000574 [Psilocybe cf. subviscida]|uniref:Btz domain-containing protein n=1 Tax=Psilocybe cf. subviscida TaxID=2480587 RepID=A0A8H5F2U9_9AGAR|nr:hypothetical protein D9619_000574 [Psilocybe cf. subviscida]
MSATVAPTSSAARAPPKADTLKPRDTAAPAPKSKKRRIVRRRGRGRGGIDSDDEIVREAATDSDSDDEDDVSSLDSADDSDMEPASVEDVIPLDRAHLPTPRNSQSPDSVARQEGTRMNGGTAAFFSAAGDWSEMVTDEKDNGPADLPVIEFSDFKGPPATQGRKNKRAKKAKGQAERAAAPEAQTTGAKAVAKPESKPVEPQPSSAPAPRVTPGQAARQAYQHKLETDASFVPTIGNFWGHDDRLIDPELRSLSGWWRGRGRGRGRGIMRGRGGFQGPPQSRGGPEADSAPPKELPPIEKAWGHDGFEDMKRKEEERRAEVAKNPPMSPKRGGFAGRGGFVPRGRGGFARGGFNGRPTPFIQPGKVRFAMKPEHVWTKQHEAFLYFDPSLKPRAGQGAGFRVKLPGKSPQVIRTPVQVQTSTSSSAPEASTSKMTAEGSDSGDKYYVVRLPHRAGKEREVSAEETTMPSLEEVFTVRPELAPAKPKSVSDSIQATVASVEAATSAPAVPVDALPEPTIRSQLEQLTLEPQPSDPERQAKTEFAVLRQPSAEKEGETEPIAGTSTERPTLAPLQVVFSPPPPAPQAISQPPPAYGSPYGYHPALPPGVAMDHNGMPYELATGRHVYLPQPMFNPRPMMPSHFTPGMPFVPGHMHHPSATSPDFLHHTSPPPMNGFIDPSTGTPIFSFPRQTTRIEIRAPTEESERASRAARTSSGLRTTAPAFQPSRPPNPQNNPYDPSYDNIVGQPMDGNMGMMYQPYQQYYYPEAYGYPPYVDMSQGGQYDMYNTEQVPQGTVYY